MLEKLSSVDWASLSHAYGPAVDVPDLLRGLASRDADVRKKALRELNLNVIHQSTHWPGCVEVVPFLFELLANEDVPDRHAILVYLQYLAVGGVRPFLSSPPRAPEVSALSDDDLGRRTYEAIVTYLPQVERLLGHANAQIRTAAAFLVAWFPGMSPDTADSLSALLDDGDEQVAASAALALAFQGHDDPRLLLLAIQSERAIAQAAAAVALGWLGRREEVIEVLEGTIRHSRAESEFPWTSDLEELALTVLLPLDTGTRRETIDAILTSFRGSDYGSEYVAGVLLEWAFPGGAGQPERLLEDLSAIQMDIAFKVLVKAKGWALYTQALRGHGLPKYAKRLAIYLGDAPADLLETRIQFEREGAWHWWPVWKCLLVAARDARRGTQAEVDATARQFARELGPRQLAWLSVWETTEVASNWEDVEAAEVEKTTARALELSLGDSGFRPLSEQYLRRRLSSRGMVDPLHLQAFIEACVVGCLARQRGATFDERHESVLALAIRFAPATQPLYDLLEELPRERLESLLLASLALPGMLREYARVTLGVWRFLPLCPSPAVLEGACDLLDRSPLAAIDEACVVALFANANQAFLGELVAGPRVFPRVMAERALIRRRGGPMTDREVRREIRQRFWEGVELRSLNEEHAGLNPCVLCAQVYLELGLADLGPGAVGAIFAPNERGTGGVRKYTELRGGFLEDALVASRDKPVPVDSAVLEAVRDALASGAVDEPDEQDQTCCEIGALHLLAARIRQGSTTESDPT